MPVGLAGAAVGAIGTGVSSSNAAAASHEAAKMQMYAAAMQMQNNANALKQYRKQITPYQNVGTANLPGYQKSIDTYQSKLPGYDEQVKKYQDAVNAYNQAAADYKAQGVSAISDAASMYKNAIPEMTKAYGMEDYKNSPLYTPMVSNLAELQATPGYQFQLQQGQKALAQSAAARGGLLSGAQLQAAQGFGQQQAATGFQAAWDRAQQAYQNAFNQNLQTQQQRSNVLGQNISAAQALAGGYQNAAAMASQGAGLAGTGANLYSQGMGLYGQDIANRLGAVNLGFTATNNLGTARFNAANNTNTSLQNFANSQSNAATNQANITNSAIGQGLSAVGGLVNYGSNNGWFNSGSSTGPSPTWSGGVANTGNRISGFADLINSAPAGVY